MSKTILVLVPHPDDAEFYAGGTLARFSREGDRIIIVTTTDGSKGSFDLDSQTLIKTRKAEALKGASRLGVEKVVFLDYSDMELDLVPPDELRRKYVQAIREYKPDILVSEDCMYFAETHPDHRVVASLANEAVTFANLPLLYPEQLKTGLEPHFTPEKYFYTEDIESANHIVDISHTFEDKMAALLEHESQVKFLVEDIFRQAKMAGIDLKAVLGDAVNDHRSAMEMAMRLKAVEVGAKAGFNMGEAFRTTRFHPVIENLLNNGS